jgi:hypothetical protein
LPILYTAAFAVGSGANVALALPRLPFLTASLSFHGLKPGTIRIRSPELHFLTPQNYATLCLIGDNDAFESNGSNRESCLLPLVTK